ncbi:hypothetical protein EPN18_03305 [bacterium]|nr:MAG: hypothetical protein EPN18_03305 [bacterium]
MFKIFIGILLGILILAGFAYFGGAKYLKTAGVKTEQAGEKLELVEKQMKQSADSAKKTVSRTADKVKKLVP